MKHLKGGFRKGTAVFLSALLALAALPGGTIAAGAAGGDPATLSLDDTPVFPGKIQFTGNNSPLGAPVSIGANGVAQMSWTPTDDSTVTLKAVYIPAIGDRYGQAESASVDYTQFPPIPQNAPTGLTGCAPTLYGGSDGKITGTTGAMEYRLDTDSSYTPVAGTEIDGLSAGTYDVRYAAKPGYIASPNTVVTVPDGVNHSQNAPTGLTGCAPTVYGGSDGKITGTTGAMEYRLDTDSRYTPVAGTEIDGLSAGTYDVRYAAKPGYITSPNTVVTVPDGVNHSQNAPTGLIGCAPTVYGGSDGKITGTTGAMEYRLDTDSRYTPVAGTEIDGLSAGTYDVRYAAKPGYIASPDAIVTLKAGPGSTTGGTSGGMPVAPIIAPAPATGLGTAFLSDTTASLSVDNDYTFKITSLDGKVPTFVVGTAGVFDVSLVKQDGSDYYFKITAIGAPGRSAGIYIDGGARLLIVTVERNLNYALCDTTCPFGVESGKSYVFKITAKKKPDFEAGTPGVFRLEFLYRDGENYYYRITATGKPGDSCGFYLNGLQQPVSVATIR